MAVQQQSVLEQAKQAKRLNDLPRARALVGQIIKSDPRNEEAWLLFADLAEKPEHVIYSLEQVLKINPVNMDAVDRLNALKTPAPAPRPAAVPAANRVPAKPLVTQPVRQEPESERVIREERMSGAVLFLSAIVLILGLMIPVLMSNSGELMKWFGLAIGFGMLAGMLLSLPRLLLAYFNDKLILTSKRIVIKRGFLNRNTFEVLLTKVEGIGVKQPLVGRMLGFGTIVVTGTGGARQTFRGLRAPEAFRERVQAEIAKG